MHEFDAIIRNMNNELSNTEKSETGIIAHSTECISICHKYLQLAKERVKRKDFKNETEEIHFFKKIKPVILSRLNYYVYIRRFNITVPLLAANTLTRHYEQHLEVVSAFSITNRAFVTYLNSDSTHRDKEYFLRYSADYSLHDETMAFHLDPAFSTFYDIKAGECKANEDFGTYLANGLQAIKNPEHIPAGQSNLLKWTEGGVSLVELIYALYANKSINNGKATIRNIAQGFSELFGTKLEMNDVYRDYLEIKERKSGMRFLDSLKHNLELKIKKELKSKQKV